MKGVCDERRSKSGNFRSMPQRPANASKCTTAFVEPPIAISARIAFSNASFVRIFEGRKSSQTMSTMRRPLASAHW
jgi:hypothetical protein